MQFWVSAHACYRESYVVSCSREVAYPKAKMATKKQIADSDASNDSETESVHTPEPEDEEDRETSLPQSTLSHRFRQSRQKPAEDRQIERNSDDSIAVIVPAPERRWEYQPYRGDTTVDSVIEAKVIDDREWYTIDYEDGRRELVSVLSYYFAREMMPVSSCTKLVLPVSPIGSFLVVGFRDIAFGDFESNASCLFSSDRA
jgi:hypothetical protein